MNILNDFVSAHLYTLFVCLFFFGSFVFFSCFLFTFPIAVDIVLVCCYIMVVGDWFAWSVAAMVGSECVAFFFFVCLFVCLYTLQIYTKTYMYTYIW